MADYFHESRRPLASLLFVLPLLALYEGGVLLLGPSALRNGADVWLRQLLDFIGLGGYFLLPVLTVGMLLAWHHTTGERWHVSSRVLSTMLFESALLGLALLVLAHMQGAFLSRIGLASLEPSAMSLGGELLSLVGKLVAFFGAGIYEEVLFRLMLLPLAAGLISAAGGSPALRAAGAVVLTSLAFSAAHYVGPHGEAFAWYSFLFRFVAGGFFAVLFVYRGFGIAAGTHALYDVFVGLY